MRVIVKTIDGKKNEHILDDILFRQHTPEQAANRIADLLEITGWIRFCTSVYIVRNIVSIDVV